MNNSLTNYRKTRLEEFFTQAVEPKEMALTIRRAVYLLSLSYIRSEDTNNPMRQEWVDDSFYFLTELAECLDPVLEDE